jgi:septal ring factor EnvC (AmiA/AmiB activator)
LIARSEKDMEAARKAAQAADDLRRKIEDGRNQPPPAGTAPVDIAKPNQPDKEPQVAALPKGDRSVPPDITNPALMQPARPFADGRGHMNQPVVGVLLHGYGEDDGSGLNLKGIQIAARGRAVVTSPADGWVLYAGTFRSYGKLLIINGGGGYHVVLAGMERIDVEIGQFVLAGEPVGEMGDRKLPSAQIADIKSGQPVLYVEFRKDGTPIDPSPWWAKNT